MKRLPSAVARLLEREEPERRIGPFFLVRQLGHGSFAPVWFARERYGSTELRVAAVKLFSLEAMAEGTLGAARDRIVEEARVLCRVEHPHVVRFYALPIDEESLVMGLAMEYLGGTTLEERIVVEGRLSIVKALRIGISIASALAAVHRAGLIHRDVKPANIIEWAGVPKLIDFGIAAAEAERHAPEIAAAPRATGGDGQDTKRTFGLASGTPGYIDPLCLRAGALASASSDVYALGATLFACLTGHVPAAVGGKRALDKAVLEGRCAPPDLRAYRDDAPPPLAELIGAMIAPDRALRPASADDVAAGLERIRRGLLSSPRPLPPEEIGPFRGLSRFEERDRDLFFGRSREIAAALEGLRGRGLVALVGPSGSGKSSLARAGLLPAIEDGALGLWPPRWDTAVVEPGRDPRASLVTALAPYVPDASTKRPRELLDALTGRAEAEGRGLVLLVDPLEELITIASGEGRDEVASLLGLLGARAIPGVRAIIAARRDLLDPLLAMDRLGEVLARGLVLVEPLTAPALSEVIDEALTAYGYAFEDSALREELSAGIEATAGAMPLVEFALAELWKQRDIDQKKLTRHGLRAIGGVAGALSRHAEATLATLGRAQLDALEAARAVLLTLTTPEGTRATHRTEEIEEIAGPMTAKILSAFITARLVVPAPGGVTLAHEALIAQWSRLERWVIEAREDRKLAEEIERDAARRRKDSEAVLLWRGQRLTFARGLAERGTVRMSEDAMAFLRSARRAERRRGLFIVLASGAMALLLAGSGLAYIHLVRNERAAVEQALLAEQEKRQAIEAASREIARLDQSLRDAKTREEADAYLKEIQRLAGVEPPKPPRAPVARMKPPAPPASADTPPEPAAPPPVPFRLFRE